MGRCLSKCCRRCRDYEEDKNDEGDGRDGRQNKLELKVIENDGANAHTTRRAVESNTPPGPRVAPSEVDMQDVPARPICGITQQPDHREKIDKDVSVSLIPSQVASSSYLMPSSMIPNSSDGMVLSKDIKLVVPNFSVADINFTPDESNSSNYAEGRSAKSKEEHDFDTNGTYKNYVCDKPRYPGIGDDRANQSHTPVAYIDHQAVSHGSEKTQKHHVYDNIQCPGTDRNLANQTNMPVAGIDCQAGAHGSEKTQEHHVYDNIQYPGTDRNLANQTNMPVAGMDCQAGAHGSERTQEHHVYDKLQHPGTDRNLANQTHMPVAGIYVEADITHNASLRQAPENCHEPMIFDNSMQRHHQSRQPGPSRKENVPEPKEDDEVTPGEAQETAEIHGQNDENSVDAGDTKKPSSAQGNVATAVDANGGKSVCPHNASLQQVPENYQEFMILNGTVLRDQQGNQPRPSRNENVPGLTRDEKGALKPAERIAGNHRERRLVTQVDVNECEHLLSLISSIDTLELCEELDNVGRGSGIKDLIQVQLTVDDFKELWSCSRGGSDPPMSFLFYLASMHGYTLKGFQDLAQSDNRYTYTDLIKLIDAHKDHLETRLDKLEFRLLIKISKLIRSAPIPLQKQNAPIWKRLASLGGLSQTCIKNLDAPTSREPLSLTEVFITHMTQAYPNTTVAWLAAGLKDIKRLDILSREDLQIFQMCREKGCIPFKKE